MRKIVAHEYSCKELLESLIITQGLLTFCDMAFAPRKTAWAIANLVGEEYIVTFMDKIRECFVDGEELTAEEQAALLAN